MGGEGHMLDMIRRLEEGRTASKLRRERTKEKMKHAQAGEPFPLPDTTPEEMGRIIRQTEEKKEGKSIEETFGELDLLARKLEDRETSLEESFCLYRQGMELLKDLNGRLDTVEKKMLQMNEDGTFREF